MASQRLSGVGMCIPMRVDEATGTVISTATYIMDATGEIAGYVCRVPKTGTIEGVEGYVGAVTNAPDNGIRGGIQGVSLTTGLNDGTFVASVTSAAGTPSAAGWFNPGTFGTPIAKNRGDLIAIVFDNPSFTAGDSIAFGHQTVSSSQSFPLGISATNSKQTNAHPIFALRYNDGSYGIISQEIWSLKANARRDFQSDTSPDEYGLCFDVPWPCTLDGFLWHGNPGEAANVSLDAVVYDTDGSTALATLPIDGDVVVAVNTQRSNVHYFASPVSLGIGRYRLVLKAGSSTINIGVYYAEFNSLELMDSAEGGRGWYSTGRTDAGAWTDYNNGTDGYHKPRISLLLNGFDDATGGGGGGGGPRVITPGF